MKKVFLVYFLFWLLVPSMASGEDLYEKQLDRGIENSEPYSYLLIEQSKADNARTVSMLKDALKYSPDLPAVYFELSKTSFSLSPEGMFESVDYMLQGIATYKRNFWWLFTMAGSLFTSAILSFVLAMIIVVLIRLIVDTPLLSHDINESRDRAPLLFVLLVAVISPFFLIGGLLVIIGLYMKKWDRISVYLFILFLLSSLWIFSAASMFLDAPSSGPLKAVVQVNESKGNKYALSVLKGRDGPVEQFSYALALKREGRYNEAINTYDSLIAKRPSPVLYNNLGNCYVAIGDIERAKELYKKSIELQPLAATFYNLSEVSRETLDFEKGDEYFLSAQRLDRDAVSRFRTMFGRNPNRFVVDENLPISALWEYAVGKTAGSVSSVYLSTVPPALLPVIAFVMVILFYLLSRHFRHAAYRCNRCGKILCNKCEKRILWHRMCLQCYRSLVKLDELDAKERIARVLAVYDYQKRRRDIIKTISLIMPGSGQIYAGNILYGFVFLWPFLFFLFIPLMDMIFVPETSYFSHTWLSLGSLLFMAIVYVISNVITRRRLLKGWL
jgi:tetratricopeptide (TPR) repeat protein